MREYLSRIAVGPAGSRDLTESEAYDAMRLCLSREASDVQIGVFLIAERMKRETRDENVGFLRALTDASIVVPAPTDRVVALCDPYDGFKRVPHFAPVVAALLGAVGIPTLVHGARSVPPKHGYTHRVVLEAMGLDLGVGDGAESVSRAAHRLAKRGVAYVDLEDFCPALHGLTPIRDSIAKRPFLATLEKLIVPIRGRLETHVVSGWVHSGYEELMTDLIHTSGLTSSLLVKGREGHTDLRLGRDSSLWIRRAGEGHVGSGCTWASNISGTFGAEISVGSTAQLWKDIFSGQSTPAASLTVHLAACIWMHIDPAMDRTGAMEAIELVLADGRAQRVFDGFCVSNE